MDATTPALDTRETVAPDGRRLIYRHPLVIRLAHWINAAVLLVLLMSGLQIFNAHPALYWGAVSTFDDPALAITSEAGRGGTNRGVVYLGATKFDTTGWLGLSKEAGSEIDRAFPSWATLPAGQDLATGRRWHFLFAWFLVLNGAVYLAYGLASGQLRRRLIPDGDQIRDFGGSVKEHLLLRFPEGEEAKRYNVIQKLTYLAVVLVLLPAMVLAGLAMSPGMDAAWPWLIDLFGGRQSARTVHFIAAGLLVLFVIVHVVLVLVSGVVNNLRGMITGWFSIGKAPR
ncbi:cytochrome b/b6 domain-containing protein [Methylobacterium sp. NEAU 140]|uniref:cytochrome b/b6 domain-containing protein n=1 Tax=Methylobacterium sp. NEAU 140 TaxID=3064945 RepID=UPI002735CC6B|nr:cytochrome b/b6 domain-containing protein [Methylobacterium sp. NEAU 140]MDP4026394.1 cytochrome b/b6 domain-containing protein [Methylobacterium sp. NEAU 140]